MTNNDLMLVFHDLIERLQACHPSWSLELIEEELQECASDAVYEVREHLGAMEDDDD